ncbi:haloacid dehalogenase superfamily, subfamily IA, variant 1 with third motif having Dx(3-4)D or Dx(3-4)E [Natronoarchaeum philippinense]|uniref:Haloacid dehalogenase superfamily, subfamily IA, variant 1 with third motif having Dx(3-4)D or Dx(3-4)E n=1 Tax=Natronoarchaeum philippinense TaxID=558529 RepID=A0A285P0K5_NATPI|nr:HAD family hydrolase [Natronoarchaeum philippinense]SNZ15262.1 haloacid dehalogenase superfamily, subfamily IA, variant 1 with third motif having Dx(3-4)D or Dx(3-4)E [Natronoarchaeum philippinense]
MTYDAVIFDNDGVLVERTDFDILREATRETFSQFGVTDLDPDHIDDMTVGATPRQVDAICDTYDLDPETFWRTRDGTLSRAQQAEIRAGRKPLYDDIGTLTDLDVEMGIVSSNQQETVDYVLDHFDISHQFATAYGREPTIESLDFRKPNPYYLEQALADIDADSALFVGDNESDIRAADNAGIDSAFIRRPHRSDWYLNSWPTWEIDSLEDLHGVVSA